jgi:hypothetical protein
MKNRLTTHQIVQVYKLHKNKKLSFIEIGELLGISYKTASSCWYVLHKQWSNISGPGIRKSYKKALTEIRQENMMNGRKNHKEEIHTEDVSYSGPKITAKDMNQVGTMLDPTDPIDKALIGVKEAILEWTRVHEGYVQNMRKEIDNLKEYKKYEPMINAIKAIADSTKE